MGQICATSGVCFKMHWASHVGRDLRLGMKNGEVRNHTRNFLIQSCRAHRHWTHCDSFLGLLRNSPFQAPSSRLTKTARRGGTKRKQAKIPPCLKILKANSIRNENSKSKSKGRQQALSWSKSFKQKAAWVLRKWEHFQNTEHHPPPPLWSTPIFPGNWGTEVDFPNREGPAVLAEGDLCQGQPQTHGITVSLTRKMTITMDRNSNAHKQSDTPRADDWYRQGPPGSEMLCTHKLFGCYRCLWSVDHPQSLRPRGGFHTIYGCYPSWATDTRAQLGTHLTTGFFNLKAREDNN